MIDYSDHVERFESKTIPEPNTGCLLWTASASPKGYGWFSIRDKNYRASRIAWEMFRGPIPQGLLVCHKCDTPACVNVNHLFIGTQLENRQDCKQKGRTATGDRAGLRLHPERAARGDRNGARLYRDRVSVGVRRWFKEHPGVIRVNGRAKLVKDQVIMIIAALMEDSSVGNRKKLAVEYGVSEQMIGNIWKKKNWKHLHDTN